MPFVVVAAAALVSSLVACADDPPAPPKPTVVQSEPPPPPPPPADPLEQFHTQKLTWGPCGPFADSAEAREAFGGQNLECARLMVPLDYAQPAGARITIGVLRHKAAGERIGSLVINPGGPGASGMVAAASLAGQAGGSPLGQRFDLVGFDPRGVGASRPAVRCLTDAERDADRADDSETDGTPQGVARQEAEARDFGSRCVQRTEHGAAMLANLGTRDVARDLDILRAALGDAKLSYLGYSYGTQIGYTYAEAFPDKVRAMVLDGAVDPEQDPLESALAQQEGFAKAFGEFVTWCGKQGKCPLGTDATAATKAYQDLVRPLIDKPVKVGDRKLSYEDATIATIQALYSQQFWQQLSQGLTELDEGRGETLLKLADAYNGRGQDGRYTGVQDSFTAIGCVDNPRITDKARIADMQRRAAQAAPFLDDGKPDGAALDTCAFWPVPNTSQPHLPKVEGVPPVLVVSTTGDPSTPYQAGVNLAKAMKGALLTFEGTQHTVFLQGNTCVDEAGTAYLVDGKLPAEGTRCSP
ncbi:alpha/beta hydrolase [Amycolatopsis suaedae]|uniref:Alpha/beta hydrolase n=1 Tax=Amycolatopsis suaedae TaxID=2510978 RepID=A0A4Q7J5J5_9PSEU|nr:alpha/beta hydrolase [Amycolatopsis suaedae]RZQ62861.1 alpha/beta hydrolase [Amycolatopsis suaedae]